MNSCNSNSTVMPADFCPTEKHIIIGRGRVVKQHPANQTFDKMIAMIATEYSAAACKAEKGNILSKLIMAIHEDLDGFIKKDPISGRWVLVEESLARTTAAQALRNYLSTSYRSSKQFKSKRRLQQIKEAQGGMHRMSMTSMTMQTQQQENTRCVSPSGSSLGDEDSSCCSSQYQDSSVVASHTVNDTFSILYAAFGESVASPTDDPFAPTPLRGSPFNGSAAVTEPTPLFQGAALVPPSLDADFMSCLL